LTHAESYKTAMLSRLSSDATAGKLTSTAAAAAAGCRTLYSSNNCRRCPFDLPLTYSLTHLHLLVIQRAGVLQVTHSNVFALIALTRTRWVV